MESVEFVRNLILRPDVERVVIAYPFFDDVGVESLLKGLGGGQGCSSRLSVPRPQIR